jgi:non-heme chloroperoxidase
LAVLAAEGRLRSDRARSLARLLALASSKCRVLGFRDGGTGNWGCPYTLEITAMKNDYSPSPSLSTSPSPTPARKTRALPGVGAILLLATAVLAFGSAIGDVGPASTAVTTRPPAPVTGVPATADLRVSDVVLAHGVRLRVAEQGAPDGECLVLLHGYPDSWQSWSPIMPLLPDRYRVIAPDLRGHGDSDRPAGGYTTADMARDVIALLDARGVRRAVLVGHSMGSFVAQEIAVQAPERVSALVLEGSAPSLSALAGGEEVGAVIAGLSDPVPADFVREFQLSAIHRPLPDALMDGLLEASAKLPARVFRGVWEGMPRAGAEARLAAIEVPTLLVWGERDAMFGRAAQDQLLGLIRGARLLPYAEVGHSPHWEVPAAFTRDLLAFLAAEPKRAGGPVPNSVGSKRDGSNGVGSKRLGWDTGLDG